MITWSHPAPGAPVALPSFHVYEPPPIHVCGPVVSVAIVVAFPGAIAPLTATRSVPALLIVPLPASVPFLATLTGVLASDPSTSSVPVLMVVWPVKRLGPVRMYV